ncbi:MAG: asparagine synthase (glutamine-hydrolyzing), partial [Gemmatimonadaceae bacterium]
MCGIAGLLKHDSGTESLEAVGRAMTDAIVHRGPDDEGLWSDREAGVLLGFRRLAIIELSALGHQPMASVSGRYQMVFNGEVFNHNDLRAVLERDGWRFRGHSDTEVILASFERWGIVPAVQKFIGMFAIAVWDTRDRKLSLIRDRLGIKPVYYYHRRGIVAFASELKCITKVPGFDASIDRNAVAAYLRYLYIPAPQTIYQFARKLLPGHILTVDESTAAPLESQPYWSVEAACGDGRQNLFRGDETEAVDELTRLLSDAVRLRMEADVPLGALLSGGVDSSTVVSLMQANATSPTRTFSIGFPGTVHDESVHAASIAARLGTDHTEMQVTADDALAVVPLLAEMFDEPLADPSQIPTYLVSKLARREVTVALSGDGGDELFAGYDRYLHGERMIPELQRLPRNVRRGAAMLAGAGSAGFWDRTYGKVSPLLPPASRHRLPGQKIRKLGYMMSLNSSNDMYRSLLSTWQDPAALLADADGTGRIEGMLEANAGLPLLDRMMVVDQATYLADDLLAKVDRASMAVSLEARVPILDHRVVEFSWTLPRHLKIRDGRGKWVLRQVLYRFIEPSLVDRPKVGFTVPIADWLRGPLRPWAEDL